MAKLNKKLQDYLQFSFLLKPIGETRFDILKKYQVLLNRSFNIFELEQQQNLQIGTYAKDVLKFRRQDINTYKLGFMTKDYQTEWSQFQIIYKCHFVIAIYDQKDNDINKIHENIGKLNRALADERRKIVGLFVLNADNLNKQKYFTLEIDKNMMLFLPQLSDQDLSTFLQPQINKIVREGIIYLIDEIKKLKNQENDYIVFNKNQERPQAKTVKKKKRGRCLKLAGDLSLMLQAQQDAFGFYKQSFELLKKCDDYHWMMGVQQGRAAIIYLQYLEYPKFSHEQDKKETYIEQLNEKLIDAIVHIRKSKMLTFQSECFFKAFHAFETIGDKNMLDDWVVQFVNDSLKNYVLDDQFIFLCEIGMIFQKVNMLRKRNYHLSCAAQLYLQQKPDISRMLFKYIQESDRIKQWKQLYLKLLRVIIKSDPNDNFKGTIHCELIDSCCSKLVKQEMNEIIQKLNYSSFQQIQYPIKFLELRKFNFEQSLNKPKDNKLNIVVKQSGIISTWKKNPELKYHAKQKIKIIGTIINPLPLSISIKFTLGIEPILNKSKEFYIYLQPNKLTDFEIETDFDTEGNFRINSLIVYIWNFKIKIPLPKEIRIQIYEQTSKYEIQAAKELTIQSSSELKFDFKLVNTSKIKSSKIRINVSVYYTLEIGLQQNLYVIESQDFLNKSTIQVECMESKNKKAVVKIQNQKILIMLQQFRVERKFLKKIEINVDYIRKMNSKYQISSMVTLPINLKDSLKCTIFNITPMRQELIPYFQGLKFEESKFKMYLSIKKNEYDLKAYSMKLYNKNSEQIDSFIISEKTQIIRVLNFDKIKQCYVQSPEVASKIISEFLKKLILIKWECITTGEKGQIIPNIYEELDIKLVQTSNKTINVRYFIEDQNGQLIQNVQKQLIMSKNKILTINYEISSSEIFDHQISLEPIIVRQGKLGYAIQGKTIIKQQKNIKNEVEVQFQINYSNIFLFCISMGDTIYVDDKLIKCPQN